MPRGRAWQSNEGGPVPGIARAFDLSGFDPNGFQTKNRDATKLSQFWAAIAVVVTFIMSRWCDLRLEFWCATHKETDDLWMAEYGLPDACDPFPDLCTKVAALGGTRCEYYAALAARAGWSISCDTVTGDCGDYAGFAEVGCAQTGTANAGATIVITVNLSQSPAFIAPIEAGAYAGNFQVGGSLACDPDISPLVCLLSRVVHAHVITRYETFEEN
jgi:hypothetical protein